MDRSAELIEDEPGEARCWCCDISYPMDQLAHLGAHPEVAVCPDCARFLYRRAAELSSSGIALVRLRRATRVVREMVVEHRFHERRFVGPALRRVDKFLP